MEHMEAPQSPRQFIDSCSLYRSAYVKPVELRRSLSQISLYCYFSTQIRVIAAACAHDSVKGKRLPKITKSCRILGMFLLWTKISVVLFLTNFTLYSCFPGRLGLVWGSL